MQGLVAASALVGGCSAHHDPPFQASDPVVEPPRDGPGVDPVVQPAQIPPTEAPPSAANLRVETAWLNERQLVVHIISSKMMRAPTVEASVTSAGVVPHLRPSVAGGAVVNRTEAQREPLRPPSKPVTVVFEAPAANATDWWLLLRDLEPSQEVRIDMTSAQGGPPVPLRLRLPAVLGGAVTASLAGPPPPSPPPPVVLPVPNEVPINEPTGKVE
jgi:hypothetical protein